MCKTNTYSEKGRKSFSSTNTKVSLTTVTLYHSAAPGLDAHQNELHWDCLWLRRIYLLDILSRNTDWKTENIRRTKMDTSEVCFVIYLPKINK